MASAQSVEYDAQGQPIQATEYDAMGNPLGASPDKSPALAPLHVTPDVSADMFKAGVHSKMLGVTPGQAYEGRDQIKQELGERAGSYDDGKLDPTLENDIKVGLEGSVLGLMKRNKLPSEVANPGMLDKFVTGLSQTIADLPVMAVGGAAGGAAASETVVGTPFGAAAGAFAIPAVMREALTQGIKNGKVTSFSDLLRRSADVVWAGTKGAITGVATEAAGGIPVGSFLAKSPITATAVKGLYQATALTTSADLLEGKLPSKGDFAGTAALIVPLNLIIHGSFMPKGEANQALMDVYAKDGKTPTDSSGTLAAQPPVKPDLPEGLRPAINTGESFVDGDTTENHAQLSERTMAKRPVSMDQLEADPAKADTVLETPAIHEQSVIDRAWEIKSDAIDAGDVETPEDGEKPLTIEDLYDRGSMKTGRGFVTPDGKFLSRMEARKWMKDNEPDVHEMWQQEVEGDKQAELHSEDYAAARNRVQARNVAEGDADISKVSPENAQRLAAARTGLNKIKAGLESTGYGKEVLRTLFAGQRDTRIAATTQLRDSLKKLLPDFHDQEALSILRDYKDRPEKLVSDLEEIRSGDNERLKGLIPSIERAMNPSPALLEADQKLTSYYSAALNEGRELGFMESRIDPANYSPHILTRILEGEQPSTGKGGPMSQTTPFAKERNYPTILDAMKTGHLDARTVNALDALSVYGDRHATVVATKLLATELKNTDLGKYGTRDDHPDGWQELAPGSYALRSGAESFYVPKDVASAMKPLFEQGLKGTPLAPLLRSQGYVKALELGLSLFHVKALNITAFNNMALTDFIKALVADTKSPEFAAAERGWAADGLTTAKTQTPYEAYEGLKKSSVPTGFDKLADVPVIKQADALAKATTAYTFEVVQRKFKVQDASLKSARWLANNPDASNEEYFAARRSIAKEVNAAYGGLNWDILGTGKTVRDVSRLFLLAPDWTFSNVLNAKYTFEGGPAGSAARTFWAKSFATGIGMTAAMSIAIGGKYNSDAKHFDQVYLGTDKQGKEMYASWFFAGAPKDAMTLAKRVVSDGVLAGTAEFTVNKAAPLVGMGIGLASNKQPTGAPIYKKTDSAAQQNLKEGEYAAGRVLPITGVSAVETVSRALTDPNHEYSYRDLLELAADSIGATTYHEGKATTTTTSRTAKSRSSTPKSRFSIRSRK